MDIERVVVELSVTEHRVLDPADVYFLAGAGGRTEVRLRGREPLIDIRELGEVVEAWARNGFLRIHRSYAVNLRRIHTVT